jgi:hypothetical protein
MSKSAQKILTTLTLLVGVFFIYHFAAAATDFGFSYGNSIGLAATDPRIIIVRIIQIFLGLLGIIAVVLIIYAGFLWMTAAGNEEQIDRAKKTLVSALIGLMIILASLGIATFILNSLLQATGAGTAGNGNSVSNPGPNGLGGIGAIGECSVQNVYPTPNQTEVPRNTAVFITFKEAVDPKTICATVDASGRCCVASNSDGSCKTLSEIKISNIQIYKTSDGNNAATNVKAQVSVTTDHKTYTFIPEGYLGSETEDTWYSVAMTSDVFREGGSKDNVFNGSGCAGSMNWQFQVSNKIDLTPPQVLAGGIFPPPDNGRDAQNNVLAKAASGSITVNDTPQVFVAATGSAAPTNSSSPTPQASVVPDPNADLGATLNVGVLQNSDGGFKATLADSKGVSLASEDFAGKTVTFTGKYPFSLTAIRDLAVGDVGDEWTVKINPAKQADSLTVGGIIYTFVSAATADNEIAVGSAAVAAQNIVSALGKQAAVSISGVVGAKINLQAVTAGTRGNNINVVFNSPSNSSALSVVKMSGGVDGSDGADVNDQPDQPMNTVIQINFNEPILPTTVVGTTNQITAIQVVDQNGAPVSGKFTIANLYKTVEFVSDNACGVNGCGETIYCLPSNSHLTVKINAAALAACASDADCVAKSPYGKCSATCKKTTGESYPLAQIPVSGGVTDSALNSLDGNRDGNAQGPASYFNQNEPDASGDSYSWSFYVNAQMDISAPFVTQTIPNNKDNSNLDQDTEIDFNKLMMASTLVSGSTVIASGQNYVTHKNINIWNATNNPMAYWIEIKTNLVNGVPNTSDAIIKHSNFDENVSYYAQAGSGVRDIHQNCFKPSGDQTSCVGVSKAKPSCCLGVPTASSQLDANGDCPTN